MKWIEYFDRFGYAFNKRFFAKLSVFASIQFFATVNQGNRKGKSWVDILNEQCAQSVSKHSKDLSLILSCNELNGVHYTRPAPDNTSSIERRALGFSAPTLVLISPLRAVLQQFAAENMNRYPSWMGSVHIAGGAFLARDWAMAHWKTDHTSKQASTLLIESVTRNSWDDWEKVKRWRGGLSRTEVVKAGLTMTLRQTADMRKVCGKCYRYTHYTESIDEPSKCSEHLGFCALHRAFNMPVTHILPYQHWFVLTRWVWYSVLTKLNTSTEIKCARSRVYAAPCVT